MATLLSLEALEADRLFVSRRATEVTAATDPWGTSRLMWQKRLQAIDAEIAGLTAVSANYASVAMMFQGDPVIGSTEIRLDFTTAALDSYQMLISLGVASKFSERIPERGRLPGTDRSRLFLRDMPRGSVGFFLEELPPEQSQMLPSPLKEAVEETTGLLDTLSAEPDGPYLDKLGEMPPRLVEAVQRFAKVLRDAGATARILGNDHKVDLDPDRIGRLSRRLSEITVTDKTEEIGGILQGVLPPSRQFEFIPTGGDVAKGSVTEEFADRWIVDASLREAVLLRIGTATIKRLSTIKSGRPIKEQLVLENIAPLTVDVG